MRKTSEMSQQIILTTGIYDLIKDYVRRRKVTAIEGERLISELKYAQQVRRRDLPEDIVSINSKVTIKNPATGAEQVLSFVPPGKARPKQQTKSIMSPIGLALVGYRQGAKIKWPVEGEDREIEILKVERF